MGYCDHTRLFGRVNFGQSTSKGFKLEYFLVLKACQLTLNIA